MGKIFFIFFQAALLNNFILVRFLGLSPVFSISTSYESSVGMGLTVTLVLFLTSMATWLVHYFILVPLQADFLQLLSFLLIITVIVQNLEKLIQNRYPGLKNLLGLYLPLLATNCAILGLTLLNVIYEYNFFESILYSLGSGLGFTLSLILMTSIRERLEQSKVPIIFKGLPIIFISASILSMAFVAFSSF